MIETKWDYLVVKVHQDIDSTELALNTLGYENWELVSVDGGIAYLKRPKMNPKRLSRLVHPTWGEIEGLND